MSNISHVVSRYKSIDFTLVEGHLREISKTFFDGVLEIVSVPDAKNVWDVQLRGDEFPAFTLRKYTNRRVGGSYPHRPWAVWLYVLFLSELATRTGARRGDDEGNTWDAEPVKYRSYEAWTSVKYARHSALLPIRVAQVLADEEPHFPEVLLPWFRESRSARTPGTVLSRAE